MLTANRTEPRRKEDTTHPITSQSSPQPQLAVARSSWLPGRLTQVTNIQETLIIIPTPFSAALHPHAPPHLCMPSTLTDPLAWCRKPHVRDVLLTLVLHALQLAQVLIQVPSLCISHRFHPSSSPAILPPHPSPKS